MALHMRSRYMRLVLLLEFDQLAPMVLMAG